VADERIQPVTMPKWGLSMKTGKVVEWLVTEGQAVTAGMDLADIETDKIAGTLESSQDGVLRRIVAQPGADVPVSAVIAVLAPAEVPDDAIDAVVAQAREALAASPEPDDAEAATSTVEVAGHTISYATADDGAADGAADETDADDDRGQGRDVVVLVHGYGGDKNAWLFVQEPLATGRTVHALDLPGHGDSSKALAGGAGLGDLAAVVLGFLDALGIDRAHLVGHSLGGAVVAAAAAMAPGRVRSLTLVAPAGFGAEVDAEYLRGFAVASSRRELKPLLERLFADPALVTRRLVDDVLRYKRLDGVSATLGRLLDMLVDPATGTQVIDARALLAGVDLPRAVVWGDQDRILPAHQAPEPGGGTDVRVVAGAGHMVHLEAPQSVIDAVERLLAR